ncbi:DUF2157 domain-containing protein [Phycicoccus sp. MAQZ13P-2]|uniref:DUF2157 domain-containing protein n=1 Tax=Phycicoccus mangrovi TaxID=2840470 RepID=UPI001C008FD0|nr:DUF2157 domain-containing protein [Phycicoccus mangrovi]MBT9257964.1 DUF2157 domain-containing protein [Phycicoccus mangrovi]MBT9276228.1 DUF2157 domain-containing protein [Phycicoccus mangrovi]
MTSPPSTAAATHPDPAGAPALRHPATPGQLAWLDTQLTAWQSEGLLDAPTADRLRARYVAHRRLTLARIVLTLGAAFVGIGLVWTVAANLDAVSPLIRILLVALVWLALVVVAELLQRRRERLGDVASPVVGAVRLLAAAAFGAVVFQAAQSLQVPADRPGLVGLWAAGALLYGYAVVGVGPVVLGVLLGSIWTVWSAADAGRTVLGVTLTVAAAALAAVAVGVIHLRLDGRLRDWRALGVPWRELGAALALGSLFVAALPVDDSGDRTGKVFLVALGVAAVVALAASLRADRLGRTEIALAAATLVGVVVLGLWRASAGLGGVAEPTPSDWARAVVAVLAYLAVTSGYAILGGMRDSERLTWVATAALVLFTTVQAFAVFAPVLSGAVLFLAVGVVLLGTGIVADRGRRRLVAEGREARS